MLTARRSLSLSSSSAPELPRIPQLAPLYNWGLRIRQGDFVMIGGRSGSGKSTLGLFMGINWGKPALYFSADMGSWAMSSKIASSITGLTLPEIERAMADEFVNGFAKQDILEALGQVPITLCYDNPITERTINEELDAFVEIHDAWPEVCFIDNVMDMEGCASSYEAQYAAFQYLAELNRNTGMTLVALHHASDKAGDARSAPHIPPARADLKNGGAEKPRVILTVATDPNTGFLNCAVVKQNLGRQDPSAQSYVSLIADHERNTFRPLELR